LKVAALTSSLPRERHPVLMEPELSAEDRNHAVVHSAKLTTH
jgi:hypothetical protein